MYEPREEKIYFGKNFLFKGNKYIHGKEIKIAKVKSSEGDLIEVFVCSMPSKFFSFVINKKYSLGTGSGSWDEYKDIFELLKDSMLVIEEYKKGGLKK